MKRLIYISNGSTFTGEQTQWDVIKNGVMPAKCEWHQIFILVEDGTAKQVSWNEANEWLKTLSR